MRVDIDRDSGLLDVDHAFMEHLLLHSCQQLLGSEGRDIWQMPSKDKLHRFYWGIQRRYRSRHPLPPYTYATACRSSSENKDRRCDSSCYWIFVSGTLLLFGSLSHAYGYGLDSVSLISVIRLVVSIQTFMSHYDQAYKGVSLLLWSYVLTFLDRSRKCDWQAAGVISIFIFGSR
jgi:hypothetical protein